MTTKPKPRARINMLTFALTLKEFQLGPCSATDLVHETGYCRHTIVRYLRALHKAECTHIVGWETDAMGRECSPVYALGEGKDKAKKKPDSFAVTCKRYQDRKALRLVERAAA